MIKIGHIDMNIDLSLLSPYSAMPRQKHLVAVLHIMCYLKLRHNPRLMLHQSYPDIDHSKFQEYDIHISMRVQLKLSNLMLCHQRGSEVDLQMKIGSEHAGNK